MRRGMLVKATRSGAWLANDLTLEPAHIILEALTDRYPPIECELAPPAVIGEQAEGVTWPDDAGIAHGYIAAPILDQQVCDFRDAGTATGPAIDDPKRLLLRLIAEFCQQSNHIA